MTSSFSDDVSDDALVDAHLRGHPEAFAELVRRHQDHLWRRARQSLGDSHEAYDAVQATLEAAFRGLGSFRRDSSVKTWLTRITVNKCMRILRDRRTRPVANLDAVAAVGTGDDVDRELDLDLKRAIEQLPDEQRFAIILVDVGGYSNSDVATELGVEESTVRSKRSRGIASIKEAMRDRSRNRRDEVNPGSDADV